jgi:hypothetical protein
MPAKLTLIEFKKRVNTNLIVLSKVYVNENTKMEYKCRTCEHVGWSRAGDMSKKKTGCPICSGRKFSKDNILAKKEINKELTDIKIVTIENKSFVKYTCNLHGEGQLSVSRFQNCSLGCPACGTKAKHKKLLLPYEDLKKELKLNYYKLLTPKSEYLSPSRTSKDLVEVECLKCKESNFIWAPNTTSGKAGCPSCNNPYNKREEMCRKALKKLTGKRFIKEKIKSHQMDFRLEDLRFFPVRGKLEFDGVCHALQLMFEHNGEQHYKDGRGMYLGRKPDCDIARDFAKVNIANRMGYKLCVIPYTVPNRDIEQFIKKWLIEISSIVQLTKDSP